MSSTPSSSERVIGQKFDRCLADLIVKSGIGFGIGVVASVVIFRRRTWPIWLSTGFGMGSSYADCDRAFNPSRLPGTRLLAPPTAPSPPAPASETKQALPTPS